MTTVKKRIQHYVWRYYLKPWSSNGSLYCLEEGRVSRQPLKRVASRQDFYKPERLSASDLVLLRSLAAPSSPTTHIQRASLGWIETFAIPFLLADLLSASPIGASGFTDDVEATIHNFEEDLHASIERGAIKYLDALRQRDASFFTANDSDPADFLHYLAVQHLRTPKGEDAAAALPVQEREQFRRVWKVLRHIYATSIAGTLYLDRKNWALLFLANATVRAFLASDQPSINVLAVDTPLGDGLEDLKLYYPLSPSLAVLLTRKSGMANGTVLDAPIEDVDRYNRYIVSSSHRQIFSDSKWLLSAVANGLYS